MEVPMSLVKNPLMTEKKIAANRTNGSHSQGSATPEGKEHMGAAHLRHGFYAKAQEPLEMLKMKEPPGMYMKTKVN